MNSWFRTMDLWLRPSNFRLWARAEGIKSYFVIKSPKHKAFGYDIKKKDFSFNLRIWFWFWMVDIFENIELPSLDFQNTTKNGQIIFG